MEATTILALYGAALSTGIALAQFGRWFLARRSRIRIEVDAGTSSPWQVGKFKGQNSMSLWIDVINEGERNEQIAWLKVEHLHSDADWLDTGLGGEDVIPPRQRKTYLCVEKPAADGQEDMELDALEGPFRVRVISGAGREFVSTIQPRPNRQG